MVFSEALEEVKKMEVGMGNGAGEVGRGGGGGSVCEQVALGVEAGLSKVRAWNNANHGLKLMEHSTVVYSNSFSDWELLLRIR